MKKSANRSNASTVCPVSRKAYNSFVERIILVAGDTVGCAAMLDALDKYLAGDRSDYAGALTPECAMAFEMLRFDVDQAIERSAKARMRVRVRRSAATHTSATPVRGASVAPVAAADNSATTVSAGDAAGAMPGAATGRDAVGDIAPDKKVSQPFVAPLSRQERRAASRGMKRKPRWKKLA